MAYTELSPVAAPVRTSLKQRWESPVPGEMDKKFTVHDYTPRFCAGKLGSALLPAFFSLSWTNTTEVCQPIPNQELNIQSNLPVWSPVCSTQVEQ